MRANIVLCVSGCTSCIILLPGKALPIRLNRLYDRTEHVPILQRYEPPFCSSVAQGGHVTITQKTSFL